MANNLKSFLIILLAFFVSGVAVAQSINEKPLQEKMVAEPSPLFSSDSVLHLKITGKLDELFNDRKENIQYHPVLLQYEDKDGNEVSINLKAKTREVSGG